MRLTYLSVMIASVMAHATNAAVPVIEIPDNGRPPAAMTLAVIPDATGEIRFEQFADGTVVMTQRGSIYAESSMQTLMQWAKSKGEHLCPAQVFGMLSTAPIPELLFARCTDQKRARAELDELRVQAKVFRIFDGPIRSRPLLCNGQGDDSQFRTIECDAEQSALYGDTYFDADNAFWCANTLRSSSDRIMSQMLNNEGEVASTRMVSCGGNTRFRFYKRDSTSDPWNLYRDDVIGASEYFTLYSYDNDSYGDSDFRFRLTSDSGAGHRNTGYFIDD
jgi:hypothetical protein